MNKLFIIQLITSFLVGGIFIAGLSFFAEKAPRKIAGVILSLPSTVVVGYMFVAWVTSINNIPKIVPVTILTDGAVMMFTIVYVYLSKIKLPKIYSIILSLSGALVVWFLASVPFAVIKFNNLFFSLIVYVVAVLIAYYFLTIRNKNNTSPAPLSYTTFQKIGRAIFAGLIITLAVYLSKVVHPFWGGIFSGFPAVFTSTFIILHWYYNSDMLLKVTSSVAKGSIVYVVYILVSGWSFPEFGIIVGSTIAYLLSLISFFIIKKTSTQK